MKADSPNHVKTLQPHSGQGVNLEIVYRSLLRIASHLAISQSSEGVAHKAEKQYTEGVLRQTTEVVLNDLADPASATNTSQG